MEKKLYRSRTDCKVSGVCGGLGVYFGIDATFIRIGLILLTLAHGMGLLFYIIAWIVMPQRPLDSIESEESGKELTPLNRSMPGIILIIIGLYFLIQHYWWWDISHFWPLALILGGVYMIFRHGQKSEYNENNANNEKNDVILQSEEGANESGPA